MVFGNKKKERVNMKFTREVLEHLGFENNPNDGNGEDWYKSVNNEINIEYATKLIEIGIFLGKYQKISLDK